VRIARYLAQERRRLHAAWRQVLRRHVLHALHPLRHQSQCVHRTVGSNVIGHHDARVVMLPRRRPAADARQVDHRQRRAVQVHQASHTVRRQRDALQFQRGQHAPHLPQWKAVAVGANVED